MSKWVKNTCHLPAYNFVGDHRIVEISTSCQSAGLRLSTGTYISMNFVHLILCFWINKHPKCASFIGSRRSNDWFIRIKNHSFYFHPSKRDCSGLKGACQRCADTGKPVINKSRPIPCANLDSGGAHWHCQCWSWSDVRGSKTRLIYSTWRVMEIQILPLRWTSALALLKALAWVGTLRHGNERFTSHQFQFQWNRNFQQS